MKANIKKIILGVMIFGVVALVAYKKHNDGHLVFDVRQAMKKSNVMPVVVIGSGPAGYSAALYTARAGYPTLVIEGALPGGQLTQTSYVENWPGDKKILGNELMTNMKEQVSQFGVTFLPDKVQKVDMKQWPFVITTTDGHEISAFTVIIATGSTPRTLKIEGEREFWGKGVTTCATCDAPFYKGRSVVVSGGGDSAAEEALQLSAHAKSVEILVRKDKMRASKAMQDHLAKIPSIKISYNKEIKKILGDDAHVKAIEVYDTVTKKTTTQDIDGVFLAIGHEPNTTLFKDQLDMDKAGYLVMSDRTQKTSVTGVFAAGDVEDHVYRQAGVAAGSGIKAAIDAGLFLQSIGVDIDFLHTIEDYLFTVQKNTIEVEHVTTEAALNKIIADNQVVIVDFYGTFCPPCKTMLPIFESLAATYLNKIKFIKVNTSDARDLVMNYKVVRIPTFVVFKDGKEVDRKNGVQDKKKMAAWLKSYVS